MESTEKCDDEIQTLRKTCPIIVDSIDFYICKYDNILNVARCVFEKKY